MLSQESRIKDLDLSFIERRLSRLGWEAGEAKSAVDRYRNFLILICRFPQEILAPAPDIDEAWHNHILFTKEYARDCKEVFGSFLHHAPAIDGGSEKKQMEEARVRSSILYQQEFGEPYLLELDVATFW